MTENFFSLLQYAFSSNPGGPALLLADRDDLTYADLERWSARFAGTLGDLGVTPGDRVLVQTGKSPEAVGLYLGCLRLGAIYVPINTAYTDEEVAYFLTDATPALFVCSVERQASLAARVEALGTRTAVRSLGTRGDGSLMEALVPADERRAVPVASRTADDVAAILYTSGTTGRSKGAMLTHGNLATSGVVLVDYWGWQNDDVLLHALPIFHVHGLFVAMHCAMLKATPMIFLPGFETAAVLDALPRATVMMGVPTFYTRLLNDPTLDRSRCARMRLFISGSAPLTSQTFAAWEDRTGHRILERYGMSETMMNTSNPLEGERVAGTVGFPLPGVSLRIASPTGVPLPHGEVGVIEVRGPNVFKGYWQMPEKTAEEFRADGFFITGDQAVMDAHGRVSIVGREKDMIISGGYNVYPKEIEALLDAMDEVTESAVIGVPHPDFGEGVVAVVVPAAGEVGAPLVEAALAGKLARFKQPKAVVNVPELPRNAMGKVQKNALRRTYADLLTGGSTHG
ncbi:MAG: AMP-binding protein [Pseudomonadales bacterium]|jgi:malonyl-CoA/methylmalonyl-CoA synthetase